ncbi:hypothetical protein, partial [Erwinia amylovora]|uniref:hypothetical protein n=1 Tax=Erwinia amylovora TaxID=552 RepID=UPI0020BD68BB
FCQLIAPFFPAPPGDAVRKVGGQQHVQPIFILVDSSYINSLLELARAELPVRLAALESVSQIDLCARWLLQPRVHLCRRVERICIIHGG